MSRPPASVTYSPRAKHESGTRRFLQVAIAAAIVIALLSTSFRFLNLPADNDPSTVPSVVLGLASPDVSPEAAACGGTLSIPLITGATSALEGMAALLLTPNGDLILDCEGDQELLKSGVTAVIAMSWPGVVMLNDEDGRSYLNIFTGDSYLVGDTSHLDTPNHPLGILMQRSTSRMTIIPDRDDANNAAVLDMATLTAIPLRDHQNNAVPLNRIPALTSNYQGDCMVLAYSYHHRSQNTGYLGGFVSIAADGTVKSIAASEPQEATPRELATSPTCDQVASGTFQGSAMSGTTTISVTSFDGTDVHTYSTETMDWPTRITWTKSGESLLFGAGENLLLWNEPFADAEPITLYEGAQIESIALTRDPNVLAVSAMKWSASADERPERTLIVDVSAPEPLELPGYDMYLGANLQPTKRNVLLMRTAPVEIYDTVTGDRLGEIGDDAVMQQNLIVASSDPFGSSEIGLVGTSFDDLWRVLDATGAPVMESIEPPAEIGEVTFPNVSMSKDGWVFIASSYEAESGWLRNLDDPEENWEKITFDPAATLTTVQFVARGNQSILRTSQDTETTSASCFDNGDPLIFFGDSFPIDFPTLLITSDDRLTLRCSAADAPVVLDTGVVWANLTAVPGTITISKVAEKSTDDQVASIVTTSILNLRTGDRLDLGVNPEGTIFRQAEHSPWYVAPAADGSIVVVDLVTLESHTILTSESESTATGAIVSSSDDGSITAIALVTQGSLSGGGGFVVGRNDDQPEVLILHDAFDEGEWLALTTPNGPVDDLLFSPNGTYLALEVVDGQNTYGIKRAIQYVVIDPDSGDTIASSEVATEFSIPSQAWSLDSNRFIYAAGTELSVLEPTTSAKPRLVISAAGGVESLMLTPDPDIVIVNVRTPRQEPVTSSNRVSLVSGEMEMLGEAAPVPYYPVKKRVPVISTFDGTTIRFMDAATGETLFESTYESDIEGQATPTGTYPVVNLYIQSPAFTGIGTDNLQIWVWGDDLQMKSIPAPAEPADPYRCGATTSPDGRFVILRNPRFHTINGTPVDSTANSPAEVIYILDTHAEEPIWIPAN